MPSSLGVRAVGSCRARRPPPPASRPRSSSRGCPSRAASSFTFWRAVYGMKPAISSPVPGVVGGLAVAAGVPGAGVEDPEEAVVRARDDHRSRRPTASSWRERRVAQRSVELRSRRRRHHHRVRVEDVAELVPSRPVVRQARAPTPVPNSQPRTFTTTMSSRSSSRGRRRRRAVCRGRWRCPRSVRPRSVRRQFVPMNVEPRSESSRDRSATCTASGCAPGAGISSPASQYGTARRLERPREHGVGLPRVVKRAVARSRRGSRRPR